MQDDIDILDVFTDSDWAGCRRSRKSTSGGAIMKGGHCLKTWSKTQAIVAKSSGEAELYAVVRGSTEAIGMATLSSDLGQKVRIQLHIDAMAAKGMIERRGLSKVRHLDVNILWLQEQCARRILPVTKVAGDDNIADLMTKHLVSTKIIKNIAGMGLKFTDGRASKAAQLHSVGNGSGKMIGGKDLWDVIGDHFSDGQGGDYWRSLGANGVWQRIHLKPRRSLFTPFKVKKGPGKTQKMSSVRFTRGVTESGRVFEFHDNWQAPNNSHRLLDEPWVGFTTMIVDGTSSNSSIQTSRYRGGPAVDLREAAAAAPRARWGDYD